MNHAAKRLIESVVRTFGDVYLVEVKDKGSSEWTIGPGACESCGAYVPQLVRCRECMQPWLCDECAEEHEHEGSIT
jgi:hypothetical protein